MSEISVADYWFSLNLQFPHLLQVFQSIFYILRFADGTMFHKKLCHRFAKHCPFENPGIVSNHFLPNAISINALIIYIFLKHR